jgi:hypothetical protein
MSATAKTYVSRLLTRLAARYRAQLVVVAYESGLARTPPWPAKTHCCASAAPCFPDDRPPARRGCGLGLLTVFSCLVGLPGTPDQITF